jgi:phosphoribosyl-AMP cyclohydrolase / phosphoribosyl-ATP pyrophosphohydrolase
MNRPNGPIVVGNLDSLDFGNGAGLLPAIVQHADTGSVLMLGYMNREALQATLSRRRLVFFSRSKGRLWEKGETTGHYLQLSDILADCDRDTLLVTAWPHGPTCHRGCETCFGEALPLQADRLTILRQLEQTIAERMRSRPKDSYTAGLFDRGVKYIAQKVGEEAVEVALAAVQGPDSELIAECADLVYHLLVLAKAREISLEQVLLELHRRHMES